MRREDMSPAQLQERETVVSTLRAARWEDTALTRLFDKGKDVRAEAGMVYSNGSMELRVTYFAAQGLIYLGMRDELGRGISIASRCGDRLAEWLDLVVSSQEEISPDNFRTYVQAMLDAFPETYAEQEQDGELVLVPLL